MAVFLLKFENEYGKFDKNERLIFKGSIFLFYLNKLNGKT